MARGRRRAPVAPAVVLQPEDLAAGADSGGEDLDVDDFVAARHRKLAEAAAGEELVDDDGSDLGIGAEAGVMDIAVSDSEDEDEEADSDSDDSGADAAGDEDTQWGGRRRAWYGGDTHEYEIMEDDERAEALADEELEARRLQAKALAGMSREDFVDSDGEAAAGDDGADAADAEPEEPRRAPARGAAAAAAAPELPALLRELRACLRELPALRAAAVAAAAAGGRGGGEAKRARIRAHVLTGYATNVAFYLALRTDPDAADVDVRSHPVIREIVRLRALAEECEGLGVGRKGAEEEDELGEVPGESGGEGDAVAAEADERQAGSAEREVLPSMEQVMAVEGGGGGESVVTEPVVARKKKKRGRRKRKGEAAAATTTAEDPVASAPDVAGEDAAFMRKVVGEHGTPARDDADIEKEKERESTAKRRKLNRVVGALERDRQSNALRRVAPADMQTIRQEPAPPKALRVAPGASAGSGGEGDNDVQGGSDGGDSGGDDFFGSDDGGGEDDDEVFMARMLAKKEKKERKAARKAEAEAPHHYAFDDSIKDKNLRRRASSQVVHNRGLTRYRPRDRKTPRAKNREAFGKAVKKRRSVVRDPVAAKPSSYGGEASGINMRALKSSRLADV